MRLFWVLTAVIIREGMYQPLTWENSTVALEPHIQLLMQNSGTSTFLCQKLLIKPFNPRRGSSEAGEEKERLSTLQTGFVSPGKMWGFVLFVCLLFSPEKNFKPNSHVNKGSLENKVKAWTANSFWRQKLSLNQKKKDVSLQITWIPAWFGIEALRQDSSHSNTSTSPSLQEGKHIFFNEHKS